jgi:hypothetical protein
VPRVDKYTSPRSWALLEQRKVIQLLKNFSTFYGTLLDLFTVQQLRLEKNTNYEIPHYAVFSSLPSLHLSSVKIFSSTPCSQTPSVYVPQLMTKTKLHTHRNPKAKYYFIYLNFQVFRQQTRRRKVLNWMEARISEVHLLLISLVVKCWFVHKYPNFAAFSTHLDFINVARLLLNYYKNTNYISTRCASSKRTYYLESIHMEHSDVAVTP